MNRIEMGPLPKQHSMKELFGNRVVDIDRPPKDRPVNEIIQENGANLGRGAATGDAAWYWKNQGYTKRLFGGR